MRFSISACILAWAELLTSSAQTFLLFSEKDLLKYDSTQCNEGALYILNHKTAFQCVKGKLFRQQGYVSYTTIADAGKQYALSQINAGIDSGKVKWSVCTIQWHRKGIIKYIDVKCPDSIKWTHVCPLHFPCGNLKFQYIDNQELLNPDSHLLYVRALEPPNQLYALSLKQNKTEPLRYEGNLFFFNGKYPLAKYKIKFAFPDSVYPDLLAAPLLVHYDPTKLVFIFAYAFRKSIGLLKCATDTCQWTNIFTTTRTPYLIGALSGKYLFFFDDGKLKYFNLSQEKIHELDSFPTHMYIYLTASPKASYWCSWCRRYQLWLINPFAGVLYRYEFKTKNAENELLSSKEIYILDSKIYHSYVSRQNEVDSVFAHVPALCDAQRIAGTITSGSLFLRGVLSDNTIWISMQKTVFPCDKFITPEKIHYEEIIRLDHDSLRRFRTAHEKDCWKTVTDDMDELYKYLVFNVDIAPMRLTERNQIIEVYATNILESAVNKTTGILKRFHIHISMF